MKKLLALLVLVFTCQMAFCQTYDDVIKNFKDKAGVEYDEIPKLLLSLALTEVDAQTKAIMKNIDCMKMLDLSNCTSTIKNDFMAQAKKFDGKYTKLGEDSEDGETNIIFVDGDDDPLKGIIVVTKNEKECQPVRCANGAPYYELTIGEDGTTSMSEVKYFDDNSVFTGIHSTDAASPLTNKIYNLKGQQIKGSLESLYKGVYIINGKKVTR